MTKVVILHEYNTKSHFEAIYKAGDKHEIIIEDYVVLSRIALLRLVKQNFKSNKSIKRALKCLISGFYKLVKVKNIRNKVLIVGIAPYDHLMNRYKNLFKKNKCIYFTSWEYWDGSAYPKGNLRNKRNFENIIKNDFYGVACVSKKTETAVKSINNNTVVVNHSIITDKYKIHNNMFTNKRKFIFLGQFIDRKGIDIIIRWIEESKDNFQFYFAGYGELEEKINELVKKDDRVTNLGKLSKDDIKENLGLYDFLVLPSKKEPFGIAILEGLACGLPVIASNVVGPSEIIENSKDGFLFNNGDYEDFKTKMNYACKIDKEHYYNLKQNAILKANEFDCANIIKKWEKLIK